MGSDRATSPGARASGDRGMARVDEERAAAILEAAAALDARRSSEIEVDQLREAAAAAGISREAFDQALRDQGPGDAQRATTPLPAGLDIAHYTAVLRDLLGDEGHVRVLEDRIEWTDEEGLTVSLSPSSRRTTAAVSAEGRLLRRLMAAILPVLVPLVITLMIAVEEEEAIVMVVGMLIALAAALVGIAVSHHRERRDLRKKTERIRRHLDRLLEPGREPGP